MQLLTPQTHENSEEESEFIIKRVRSNRMVTQLIVAPVAATSVAHWTHCEIVGFITAFSPAQSTHLDIITALWPAR